MQIQITYSWLEFFQWKLSFESIWIISNLQIKIIQPGNESNSNTVIRNGKRAQSWTKYLWTFQVLAQFSCTTDEPDLDYYQKIDEYTSWLTICLTNCLRSWKYANFKKTLKKFVTDGNLQPSTQKENRKLCQKTAKNLL